MNIQILRFLCAEAHPEELFMCNVSVSLTNRLYKTSL